MCRLAIDPAKRRQGEVGGRPQRPCVHAFDDRAGERRRGTGARGRQVLLLLQLDLGAGGNRRGDLGNQIVGSETGILQEGRGDVEYPGGPDGGWNRGVSRRRDDDLGALQPERAAAGEAIGGETDGGIEADVVTDLLDAADHRNRNVVADDRRDDGLVELMQDDAEIAAFARRQAVRAIDEMAGGVQHSRRHRRRTRCRRRPRSDRAKSLRYPPASRQWRSSRR